MKAIVKVDKEVLENAVSEQVMEIIGAGPFCFEGGFLAGKVGNMHVSITVTRALPAEYDSDDKIPEVIVGHFADDDKPADPEEKQIFYKMYQDKECVSDDHRWLVLSLEEAQKEIQGWFDGDDSEGLPPVLEPVLMTSAERRALPVFQGY